MLFYKAAQNKTSVFCIFLGPGLISDSSNAWSSLVVRRQEARMWAKTTFGYCSLMGKMYYFGLFLKTAQQPNESNKTKPAKWCPSAVATPGGLLWFGARCSGLSTARSSVHLLFIIRFRQIILFSCLVSKPTGSLASIKLKCAFLSFSDLKYLKCFQNVWFD